MPGASRLENLRRRALVSGRMSLVIVFAAAALAAAGLRHGAGASAGLRAAAQRAAVALRPARWRGPFALVARSARGALRRHPCQPRRRLALHWRVVSLDRGCRLSAGSKTRVDLAPAAKNVQSRPPPPAIRKSTMTGISSRSFRSRRVEKKRTSRFSISSVSGFRRATTSSPSSSDSCSGDVRLAVVAKAQLRVHSESPCASLLGGRLTPPPRPSRCAPSCREPAPPSRS